MKKYVRALVALISLSLSRSLLLADIDENDFGSENIEQPAKNSPLSLEASFDFIGDSKIKKGFFKGDKVRFGEAEAEVNFVFYYCPAYSEGANLAVSYNYTSILWHDNPWFEQYRFDTLTLSLGGFSKRLDRWFWQGQASINIDAEEWDLNDYASYDLILWGRYEYCKHIGVHIGLIAQTGLQMDRVYPILGADWQVSRNWKLNLVFPVNVSLEYKINNQWSVALAGRSFNVRYRVNKHESHPKALVRYENVGAEFAVKYNMQDMSINVHVGSTLGGTLRIANRHNNDSHRYRLDSASYAGAEVDVRF